MTNSLHNAFIWYLKGNFIIWLINSLLFAILMITGSNWVNLVSSGFFSKIALLETGISFLVGGAIAFSGSFLQSKTKDYIHKTDEKWSIDNLRRNEKKANKYIFLAIVLLIESIIISLLGL